MVPKFRAWDKKTERMWDIETWHIADEYVDLIEPGKSIADINAERFWRKQSEVILMQYTGLKDKNGVEIFEGDIVNHYWSNEVGESFCHKAVIKNPFDYKVNEAMHLIYADELEILGNIWENPELLEVTANGYTGTSLIKATKSLNLLSSLCRR